VKGEKAYKSPELEMSRQERVCRRSIPVLLGMALLLAPVIFYPFGVDQFRIIKEIFCQIIIAVVLTCSLIVILERWGGQTKQVPKQGPDRWGLLGRLKNAIAESYNSLCLGQGAICGPMLFLLLVGVLSATFSTNRALSVRPLVNLFLFVILYFIIIHYIPRRHAEKFLAVILLTGMLNGLYCIIQYLGWDPIFVLILGGEKGGRMASSGLIGNPDTVGGYLASAIPLSLSALLLRRPVWMPLLGFTSLVSMALGICFNQTITAAASAIFSVFVFFLAIFLGTRMIRRRTAIAITVLVVAMGIFLATASPMKNRLAAFKLQMENTNWNIIVSNRPFIWWLSLKMIKDRPLLGSGLGTFPYQAFAYQALLLPRLSPDSVLYPVVFHTFTTPHNEYLLLGAEAGLLGIAAAGWLLVAIILLGWRSVRQFHQLLQLGALKDQNSALSHRQAEGTQRDYLLMLGFAVAVLVSAVESLTHFYFHIAPSALLAITALGIWCVILKKGSGEEPYGS
jgi:O-antigen ligase